MSVVSLNIVQLVHVCFLCIFRYVCRCFKKAPLQKPGTMRDKSEALMRKTSIFLLLFIYVRAIWWPSADSSRIIWYMLMHLGLWCQTVGMRKRAQQKRKKCFSTDCYCEKQFQSYPCISWNYHDVKPKLCTFCVKNFIKNKQISKQQGHIFVSDFLIF